MDKREIMVSICCLTYNHKKFITKCLDSFTNQNTNFQFEILVHDDASTDGTSTIVKSFEKKYPKMFRCVYQSENQFLKQNTLINILFKKAKGKYIALCEGDDYWTDPYKLQKQVDFLEANEEYVLCFHQVKILEPEGGIVDDFITKVPESYETIEAMAEHGNYIHTSSVVFKNILKEFPPEMKLSPIGDYFLFLILAEHGRIGFIPEYMSVYRFNVGVWSGLSNNQRFQKTMKTFLLLRKYFHGKNSHLAAIFEKKIYFSDSEKSLNLEDMIELSKTDNYFVYKLIYYLYDRKINPLQGFPASKMIEELYRRFLKFLRI